MRAAHRHGPRPPERSNTFGRLTACAPQGGGKTMTILPKALEPSGARWRRGGEGAERVPAPCQVRRGAMVQHSVECENVGRRRWCGYCGPCSDDGGVETISEPTRAATPAILVAGKERGGCDATESIVDDERRGLRPEVAASLRVAASAGRLPRCVSSAMRSVASPVSPRLASAPLTPATQPVWVLR
jgi:hypothetical protein